MAYNHLIYRTKDYLDKWLNVSGEHARLPVSKAVPLDLNTLRPIVLKHLLFAS